MACISILLTLVVFLTNIVYCVKILHIQFAFKGFNCSLIREVGEFTFFIFLNQIIDQINWSIDNFLLGRMVGTTAVAVYGVGNQINSMYIQFSTSVSNVFVPQVNMIVAQSDDNKELTKLLIKVGRMQFLILALILTGFIFFGKEFIRFWAGRGYEESYGIALCLIIPATIPLIQNLGIEIQRAKNKHRVRSVVYLFIAIFNVGISIPLIRGYGPLGAAIGTAIALTIGNILFMNWYYDRFIGLDMCSFWKNMGSFLPACVVVTLIGILLRKCMNLDTLLYWGMAVIVYLIAYCTVMWFGAMNEEEKQMLKTILHK
jgi:O-antigen/teichoic acid export membrane protein